VINRLIESSNNFHTVHTAYVPAPHDHNQHKQANTTCSLKQSCSPDDGHNDARNMLSLLITNKHQITVTSSWFYYLPTLTMHGHTNINLLHSLKRSYQRIIKIDLLILSVRSTIKNRWYLVSRMYLIPVIMQLKIGTVDHTSRLRHEVSNLWRYLQHNRTYATLTHEP
jgi:hypothetical protein